MIPLALQYTKKSLKIWLQAYRKSWWDTYFNPQDFSRGKTLLSSALRSITLEENYLLAQGFVAKDNQDIFVTADLQEHKKLELHLSPKHRALSRAFLAAALIKLEQLLEENLDLLLTYEPTETDKKEQTPQTPILPPEKVPLCRLRFFKKDQSLAFDISFRRKQVFYDLNVLEKQLSVLERECLVNILFLTQKYGFRCQENIFVSDEIDRFSDFVNVEIPKLSQKYFVDISKEVLALKTGVHQVQVFLKQEGQRLKTEVYAQDQKLDENDITKSWKHHQKHYWSEQHGLIHWTHKEVNWMQHLNAWQHHYNQLPNYLLFSIFNPHPPKNNLTRIEDFNGKLQSSIELRPYQYHGVFWMKQQLEANFHPLLADEMGLGKTRQLLGVLDEISNDLPHLVVCPSSVVGVWQNEIKQCLPRTETQVLSSKSPEALQTPHAGIYIISYAQLRLCHPWVKKCKFRSIVLDEAQYIKNPKSKTAHACFNLESDYRLASTGTPIENRLTDIWTIFHFLMPGLLGSYKEFNAWMQNDGAQEMLKVQIAPFLLRRKKKDVLLELPDKSESVIYCPMTDIQKQLYEQFVKNSNIKEGSWGNLLTLFLRLRQICCDPGLLPTQRHLNWEASGKLIGLKDQLQLCAQCNHKVVIFSQFRTLLERILPLVESIYPKTFLLTGSNNIVERREAVKNFQENPLAAFLISLKAGGVGITLHSADTVFLLDPWWNPALETQAIARVHRLGQKKSVTVYRLLTENSVESHVQELQQAKDSLILRMIDSNSHLTSAERWQQLHDLIFKK